MAVIEYLLLATIWILAKICHIFIIDAEMYKNAIEKIAEESSAAISAFLEQEHSRETEHLTMVIQSLNSEIMRLKCEKVTNEVKKSMVSKIPTAKISNPKISKLPVPIFRIKSGGSKLPVLARK